MATREEINALLEEVNARVFGANGRMGFEFAKFDELREQDVNANVMPPGMFSALVGNIRKNGVLESVPLVANREGSDVVEVVSGHHRIRSAREAGVKEGIVLRCKDLSAGELRAKQLAHNNIAGKSDPEIVAEIFAQINAMDLKIEAYVDPEILGEVPEPVGFKPIDLDPLAHARTMTIVFLPTQATDFRKAIDLLKQKPDMVYVAHSEAFDGFRDALHRVRRELDVHAVPSAIAEMARIVIEHVNTMKGERNAGK